jgi:5'-3' exonuclease
MFQIFFLQKHIKYLKFCACAGEAEAYCAALDAAGLVDGVVSNDSDCLCYGARHRLDHVVFFVVSL